MTPLPRESATLVPMRERPGAAPEVLLVQRHAKVRSAAGAFVFPGGILEPQDYAPETIALCAGMRTDQAAKLLGTVESPERALGYFYAAIRETFEEVGILLARDRSDRSWHAKAAALREARAVSRERGQTLARWLSERALRPAVEDLVYFAHWITPVGIALRYDTRFFLVVVDAASVAEPDHEEIVDCRWITPADALAAYHGQTMQMINATVRNLELLAAFASANEACERLRGRTVSAVTPKMVPHADGVRFVHPWEPGYDAL